MDDEKLIEQVRKYEFLYNLSHPKYMDIAKREAAWNEISKIMMHTAVSCRIRWQKLRDSYRRFYKKRKDKNEDQAIKIWKYEKEISFLKEYFTERKTTSTNTTITKDSKTPREAKRMRYSEDGASSTSTAATSNTDLLEARSNTLDDMDQFFLNISSTVKKFSPYNQAVAKNKIFSLVSEMEMQQLAPQQQCSSAEALDIKWEVPDEDDEASSPAEHNLVSSPESWTEEKYNIHPT